MRCPQRPCVSELGLAAPRKLSKFAGDPACGPLILVRPRLVPPRPPNASGGRSPEHGRPRRRGRRRPYQCEFIVYPSRTLRTRIAATRAAGSQRPLSAPGSSPVSRLGWSPGSHELSATGSFSPHPGPPWRTQQQLIERHHATARPMDAFRHTVRTRRELRDRIEAPRVPSSQSGSPLVPGGS